MLDKIVSGGQTGADRAALDFAIKRKIPHGGWVPKGRLAEDGPLPAKYKVQDMPTDGYPARTERNVIDSDGTLIISHGRLTGGSSFTRKMAKKHGKPHLHIDLTRTKITESAAVVLIWLTGNGVLVLNVAGPRASKDPHIYDHVLSLLDQVFFMIRMQQENPLMAPQASPGGGLPPTTEHAFPKTVDEVVDSVLAGLSDEEKAIFFSTSEENLPVLTKLLATFIGGKIGDSTLNQDLVNDCRRRSTKLQMDETAALKVIIGEIWKRLRETNWLKVVK
jgi:hypothetical protein